MQVEMSDNDPLPEPAWESCSVLELWSYVAWHLDAAGIASVLVGGAVVAIYTDGLYQSKDIDVVPDDFERHRIRGVLEALGFRQDAGRHYRHPRCGHLFVEFPRGPVSLGEEFPIEPDELPVAGRSLKLLSPTDCVKDRLASYIHWGVRSCFDQAVLVARSHPDRVDLEAVRKWCRAEGAPEAATELEVAISRA
jgi:hypothetical protein